jgi:hypothetical protein
MDTSASDDPLETAQGEVPEGVVGPEIFREQLRRASEQDPEDGAHVTLQETSLYLADIESVEPDDDEGGHHSIITLRNGAIIAGVTGAAIVAALATIRFRRRRQQSE